MKKESKKILSLILAFCIAIGILPVGSITAEATDTPIAPSSSASQFLDSSQTPSGFDNTPDTIFGEPAEGAYLLTEQSEIISLLNKETGSTRVGTYDNKTKTSLSSFTTSSALLSDSHTPSAGISGAEFNELSFVEGVAFDATGTGRKDHIAYVGITTEKDAGDAYSLIVQVYDARSDQMVPVARAVERSNDFAWLAEYRENINTHLAGNFIDIVAADFDADGEESIVVYLPKMNQPLISEYSYTGNANLVKVNEYIVHGGNGDNALIVEELYSHDDVPDNKPYLGQNTVSLSTGDYDDDGAPELAVAIGSAVFNDKQDGYNASSELLEKFVTRVSVLEYGSSAFVRKGYVDTYTEQKDQSDETITYTPLYQGNIASGDIDGDGADEIVVAGYTSTIKADKTNVYDYDATKFATSVINYSKDGIVSGSLVQQHTMNEFTKDGFYGDETSGFEPLNPQIAVETAMMQGEHGPATLMIAGDIYSVEASGVSEKPIFETEYFKSGVNNISGIGIDETYVHDIIKGSFDGNGYGREQFYVVAMHVDDSDNINNTAFSVVGGFVGATYTTDTETALGTLTGYYSSNFNYDHANNTRLLQLNKGNSYFVPVAADVDDDGVLGKLADKKYSYLDPEVIAVLQAAPYFEETTSMSFGGAGETSYTVGTSFTTGYSTEHTKSWALGFAHELEIQATAAYHHSLQVGYTGSHTSYIDETFTETYETTFSAASEDLIVLQRVPMVHYVYDVYDSNTKEWNEGFVQGFPMAPTTIAITEEIYNEFVDEYATLVADYNEAKSADDPELEPTLRKITSNDLPANNEGNPWAYSDAWGGQNGIILSKGSYQLAHNTGSTESSWTEDEAYTEGITLTNGFEFNMTIMGGGGAGGNVSLFGGYGGFSYDNSQTDYTTNVTSTGASGSVSNIDIEQIKADRPEDDDVLDATLKQYGFTWTFGKWDINLSNDPNAAPINAYGYVVTDITAPAKAPENVSAQINADSQLEVRWDKVLGEGQDAGSRDYRAPASGYNVYIIDENNLVTKLNDTEISADQNTYVHPTEFPGDSTYHVYVTALYQSNYVTIESLPSEHDIFQTATTKYLLNYSKGVGIDSMSAKIFYTDIPSGEEYAEASWIDFEVNAKTGYVITQYTQNDETIQISPRTVLDFSLFLKENTDISFYASRMPNKIHYTVNDENFGEITAQAVPSNVPFTSGTTINSEVEFTATAKSGYYLESFTVDYVDDSISDSQIMANGSNILNLTALGECTVTANFADESTNTFNVTVNKPVGGVIEVYTADGNLVDFSDNNKLSFPSGTKLNVKALSDDGYFFDYWTHDLSEKTGTETEIYVDKDITLGVEFYVLSSVNVTFLKGHEDAVGEMAPVLAPIGKSYTIPENEYTRDGYAFLHWYHAKLNSAYNPGEKVVLNEDIVLSAYWSEINDIIMVNGTANYTEAPQNTKIKITADTPPVGQRFKEWTYVKHGLDGITFDDASSPTTTFTLWRGSVTITANYEPDPDYKYEVSVNGGTANPTSAAEGENVNVTATVPKGKQFTNWTVESGGINLTDANSANTDFTMAKANVELTANFINAPLSGTATIVGTPKFGETLTASIINDNNTGTLTYEWKVDGISVGTDESYIVTSDDIGKTITVEISSSEQTGVLTSAEMTLIKTEHRDGATNLHVKVGDTQAKTIDLAGFIPADATGISIVAEETGTSGIINAPTSDNTAKNVAISLDGNASDGDTATITTTISSTEYEDFAVVITVSVTGKIAQNILFPNTSITKVVGDAPFTNAVTGDTGAGYKSSNEKVATVDENGKVTIIGAGIATITATIEPTETHSGAQAEFTLTVNVGEVDNGKDETTIFDEEYEDLEKVILDGTVLIQTGNKLSGYHGYTMNNGIVGEVNPGSIEVTLYKEFIATLPTGTYKLSITTKDGSTGDVSMVVPAKTEHTLTITNEGDGSKGASTHNVGEIITIDAGTRTGYTFDSWTASGVTLDSKTDSTTKFVMMANDVQITANWDKTNAGDGNTGSGGSSGGGVTQTYYDIEIEVSGEGTIEPDGGTENKVEIVKGDDKKFTFIPSEGFIIGDVFVDGLSVGSVDEYLFEDIQANHKLKVIFERTETQNPFIDVEDDDWFFESVIFVYENDIMTGTSGNTFDPLSDTTRAMMAQVIWNMEGKPEITSENPFGDVASDAWYYNAVVWTTESGIYKGMSEDKFAPNDLITREQLATIFYRYAEYKGYDLTQTDDLSQFIDKDKVSDWAEYAMNWAVGSGMINGKGMGTLDPLASATRAEIATMIHRFIITNK